MFVEETCVAVCILICKRNDLSELESLVDSVIMCDCGIVIGQGKACNQGQVD